MKTYIALLRGINVSGQKKIQMSDLRSHLEGLGWEGIRTYIQSGNILFEGPDANPAEAAQKITQKLQEKYGFGVPSLVLEPSDLLYVITNNPFAREPGIREERLYVTFLFDTPHVELARKLEKIRHPNEQYRLDGRFIFLYYPEGYGRAIMTNNAFEKALQVEATTRNWKTVNKLYELSR